MIKLIHTSDIHLGAYSLGVKNTEGQNIIKRAFKKITELCVEKEVDFLIIAGDLFNSNEPPQSMVELVKERLKYLDRKGINVIISPGNHDNLGRNSIYWRENFSEGLENIFIFNSETDFVKEFPEFNLAIISKPCFSYESGENLFKSISATPKKYNIAIIHGSSSRVKGEGYRRYFPFEPQDIANSKIDYVALGHWHSFRDESSGEVKAVYPGSPEPLDKNEKGAGNVVYVEINGGVKFEKIPISEKKFDELVIQMDDISSAEEVRERILKKSDKNLVLAVNLVGFAKLGLLIMPEILEEELGENFARLEINDKSHPQITETDLEKYPKEMVIGQFILKCRQKIDSAKTSEEKQLYEEVLRLGIAELEGKNIIKDMIR